MEKKKNPKTSVITPSVRIEMLPVVQKCLKRQTHINFEWIIVGNKDVEKDVWHILDDDRFRFILEPPKRKGDYYNLNKAWNCAFKNAKGELIVNILDGLWFEPDLLERLWNHYVQKPLSCITCVGDQFDRIENGKPENRVWVDPRRTIQYGSFYEVPESEMEFCIVSVPRQALYDVGGIDEEYDKYAAMSEKDMSARLYELGYKLYIDQTLEYRAIKHDRLNENWDKAYFAGVPYFQKRLKEIKQGIGLHLDYLDQT